MKKFTINGNESTAVKGSLIFEVTDEPEQLEITFEVDNPAWIQIFVKNDSDNDWEKTGKGATAVTIGAAYKW